MCEGAQPGGQQIARPAGAIQDPEQAIAISTGLRRPIGARFVALQARLIVRCQHSKVREAFHCKCELNSFVSSGTRFRPPVTRVRNSGAEIRRLQIGISAEENAWWAVPLNA